MGKPIAVDPVALLLRLRSESESAAANLAREIDVHVTDMRRIEALLKEKTELRKVKETEVRSYDQVLTEIARGREGSTWRGF